MMQTVKEFLKGTRNSYFVEISAGTNENVVFSGTYAELKKSGKKYLGEVVTSWDVVQMNDESIEIGIMI